MLKLIRNGAVSRRPSWTCRVTVRYINTEDDSKPKRTKKQKSIDLASALKNTSKLMVNDKEIASLNTEGDELPPSKYPSKKVDMSYTKDLEKNVLTSGARWAINKTNQVKNVKHDKKTSPEHKLELKRKRIQRNSAASRKTSTFSPYKKAVVDEDEPQPASVATPPKHEHKPALAARIKQFKPKDEMKRLPHTLKSMVPRHSRHYNERFEQTAAKKIVAESVSVSDTSLEQAYNLEKSKIPKLAHNLDRALFSPGVHFFQDPRTRVYNFPPYLKKIINYRDFNFEAISAFQTVSKDARLLQASNECNKHYYSSTSSMTSTLIQFYFLLNNYHPAKVTRFQFPQFSGLITELPASLVVIPKGKNEKTGKTVYAMESDKSYDNEILLSAMGHCLEALLTTEEHEFDKYRLDTDAVLSDDDKPANVYNYATYGDFLMRSQLDCYDERLPGNGTFDLKTRAACSVRYNSGLPTVESNEYQIWKLSGQFESFEKEFKDLITTGALLKYAFQARIGQMDGIYVAYHNVNTFFGFQYLPLSEIDHVFYSHAKVEELKNAIPNEDDIDLSETSDMLPSYVAETQFKMSLTIWEDLLKVLVKEMGDDTAFRLVLKTKYSQAERKTRMYVLAIPVTGQQVTKLQGFSRNFKTSFREDLAPQERLDNLRDHRDSLREFNEKSVERTDVVSYYIDIDQHVLDGSVSASQCPYPSRVGSQWEVGYSIHKIDNGDAGSRAANTKRYLDMLSVPTESIAMSYEKNMKEGENRPGKKLSREAVMKLYTKLGAARAKGWQAKDSEKIVYGHESSS